MIKKIKIKQVATYSDIEVEPLQINYIYGGNGTGKTTLSRFINNTENLSNGNILTDSSDCEILTYNKDFVDKNFGDNSAIQGIFSIGEDSKEVEKQIDDKIKERLALENELATKQKTINELTAKILSKKELFEDRCWNEKKNYEQFQQCFNGFRDAKEKFADKCIKTFNNNKIETSLDSIKENYSILYETELKQYNKFETINIESLKKIENSKIFNTSIVCIANNSYSELITTLNNSDWVKTGLEYLQDKKLCPFCQQEISESIKKSLFEVFDDTYDNQIKELKKISDDYVLLIEDIKKQITSILNFDLGILDKTHLKELNSEFQLITSENMQLLKNKQSSPSDLIELKSLENTVSQINSIIFTFNEKIEKNNEFASNQKREQQKLSKTAWDIMANNILFDDIEQFEKDRKGINDGVLNIKKKCSGLQEQINKINSEIIQLEATTTSIENAINEINKILSSFAFTGFKLVKAEDNRNYKIIREDGSDVKESLSEGEQRFITFLYFYQLIKGNVEGKSSSKRKIVVIDDPISSLDSNILFIVSTLVKTIISDCLSNNSLIEQVFILTHNIYFHQEVAFKGARENRSAEKECFWTIRKKDNISNINISDKNSIQTSYELLWQDVRDPSNSSSVSIFNTLRRILEYYFNIIGHCDYEKCVNEMEGQDKLLCKSLLSFINVNSHMVNDDFVVVYDEDNIDKYINVFKRIFEITGHIAHYNMMMKIK